MNVLRSRFSVPVPVAAAALLALTMLPVTPAAAGVCGETPYSGVDWSNCTKKHLMLQSSPLSGADLSGADFSLTDLSNADISGANLEKATLIRAWFAGATGTKANFSRVEAYRSSFAKATLDNASFANAELQRSDFNGASLVDVDFEKAELGRTSFAEADISGANFTLANLSRAVLTGATFDKPLNFDRAFMFQTRIEGVDLSGVQGLVQAQVDLACGDAETKLPNGLKASSEWPCAPEQ